MPSTSSGLVFGRAALLGVTAGEQSCHTAYPKCPRNEDDILYYLNNHRGGFFRFFNGGAAFGDDTNFQYNPNPYGQQQQNQQYQPPQQQQQQVQQSQQQQQTQSTLGALTSLADLVNQGGGINLSNLGANADLLGNLAGLLGTGGGGGGGGGGSSNTNTASATNGLDLNTLASAGGSLLSGLSGLAGNTGSSSASNNIGDLVGNLLTGFVGNRFNGRKLSKRSIGRKFKRITFVAKNMLDGFSSLKPKRDNSKVETNVPSNRSSNRTFVPETGDPNTQVEVFNPASEPQIQARILNVKDPIYSDQSNGNGAGHRDNQKVVFGDDASSGYHTGTTFPVAANTKSSKAIKFSDNVNDQSTLSHSAAPTFFPQSDQSAALGPTKVKMVFPGDRTGTGNLRFDDSTFQSESVLNRIARILTGIRQESSVQKPTEAPFTVQNYNRYQSQSPSQSYNQYQQQSSSGSTYGNNNGYTPGYQNYQNQNSYNQNQNQNSYNSNGNYGNRGGSSSQYQTNNVDRGSNPNIYVTNSNGQTEYYLKPNGEKVFL